MKKMLRIAAALAALLAMTNFIGCKNDDDDDGDVAVEKVEITSTSTTNEVEIGKTITLTAKVSPENATSKTVTWTSDNNEVATVKDGVVTGVKAGEATITASAGGKDATVKVTVKAAATSGGETGGSGSGETGGSTGGTTGGETGGTTGGSTGGTTGGETGTTTGFENTYWVREEVPYENSGVKITLKNTQYIHLRDSTSGSIYIVNVEDYLKGSVDAGTHSVSYPDKGVEFTYTVEGSNVTIKKGEETITAVIAADKNSFSITEGSETHAFTKVAAAPTEATVTVEVTAAPSTGVNAAWDFNVASLTAVGLDLTNKVKPNADKEIAVTSGSGATLTLLAQTGASLKIQSAETGGLNVGAGSKETEVLSITVEGACTLKINGKGSSGASSFVTTKPNSFSVNGTKVYERASADETAYQDFTYSITEAGTYKIAASGMIFTALTCE